MVRRGTAAGPPPGGQPGGRSQRGTSPRRRETHHGSLDIGGDAKVLAGPSVSQCMAAHSSLWPAHVRGAIGFQGVGAVRVHRVLPTLREAIFPLTVAAVWPEGVSKLLIPCQMRSPNS